MRPPPKTENQANSTDAYPMFWKARAVRKQVVLLSGTILCCGYMLGSVVNVARLSGQRERCYFNVKQQVNALHLYSQDWDGDFPPADRWLDVSLRYQSEKMPLHCPTVEAYGYTFNSDLAGHTLKQVKDVKETPLLYDGKDLRRNAHASGLSGLAQPPRHGLSLAQNIIGYVDGHVKYYPRPPKRDGDSNERQAQGEEPLVRK